MATDDGEEECLSARLAELLGQTRQYDTELTQAKIRVNEANTRLDDAEEEYDNAELELKRCKNVREENDALVKQTRQDLIHYLQAGHGNLTTTHPQTFAGPTSATATSLPLCAGPPELGTPPSLTTAESSESSPSDASANLNGRSNLSTRASCGRVDDSSSDNAARSAQDNEIKEYGIAAKTPAWSPAECSAATTLLKEVCADPRFAGTIKRNAEVSRRLVVEYGFSRTPAAVESRWYRSKAKSGFEEGPDKDTSGPMTSAIAGSSVPGGVKRKREGVEARVKHHRVKAFRAPSESTANENNSASPSLDHELFEDGIATRTRRSTLLNTKSKTPGPYASRFAVGNHVPELETVIFIGDDTFIEIRCPVCHGNANPRTDRLAIGIGGMTRHIKHAHPVEYTALQDSILQDKSHQEFIRHCGYRVFGAEYINGLKDRKGEETEVDVVHFADHNRTPSEVDEEFNESASKEDSTHINDTIVVQTPNRALASNMSKHIITPGSKMVRESQETESAKRNRTIMEEAFNKSDEKRIPLSLRPHE